MANVAAEVEARTIGARLRTPALDAGRSFDKVPFYGIKPIRWFPFDGSAFVIWDADRCARTAPAASSARRRPRSPTLRRARARIRTRRRAARRSRAMQKSEFLKIDGRVVNVCGTRPCYDAGWPGP